MTRAGSQIRDTETPSRGCTRPNCRAWAMRGGIYCRAHRDTSEADDVVVAPHTIDAEIEHAAQARNRRAETFARLARDGRHEELIEATLRRVMDRLAEERTLLPEIGALRLQNQRLVAVDALEGDPHQVAVTMTRMVDSIVRAMRMQHALSGNLAETVSDAFTTVLLEMGLGDER